MFFSGSFDCTHKECQVLTQKLLKNTLKEGHKQPFQELCEHRSKYIIILPNNQIIVIRLYSCSHLKTGITTKIQRVPGLKLECLKKLDSFQLISITSYFKLLP